MTISNGRHTGRGRAGSASGALKAHLDSLRRSEAHRRRRQSGPGWLLPCPEQRRKVNDERQRHAAGRALFAEAGRRAGMKIEVRLQGIDEASPCASVSCRRSATWRGALTLVTACLSKVPGRRYRCRLVTDPHERVRSALKARHEIPARPPRRPSRTLPPHPSL